MKPKEQLEILGMNLFCKLVRKGKIHLSEADLRWADLSEALLRKTNLHGADLRWADLSEADLSDADLSDADLRWADLHGADLSEADLSEADIDFSCLPLWCGSSKIKIDERLAKQLGAHVFNLIEDFWPDELTQKQKQWLNGFHRIQKEGFPRFK